MEITGMMVWVVEAGFDYDGSDTEATRVFGTEAAAEAYRAKLLDGCASDYGVSVSKMIVG